MSLQLLLEPRLLVIPFSAPRNGAGQHAVTTHTALTPLFSPLGIQVGMAPQRRLCPRPVPHHPPARLRENPQLQLDLSLGQTGPQR